MRRKRGREHSGKIDIMQQQCRLMSIWENVLSIDLNMVRAGVVRHPSEYDISGYNEIQTPPKGYSIVNQQALHKLFGVRDENLFRQMHRDCVELELKNVESKRQSFWSESVAVGDECFIQSIQQELSGRVPGRSIVSE